MFLLCSISMIYSSLIRFHSSYLHMILIGLLTADCPSNAASLYERQCLCRTIGRDFQSIIESYRRLIDSSTPSNYCTWKGIECDTNGTVSRMEWAGDDSFPVVSLKWLPPTLYFLHARNKVIKEELDTRLIPTSIVIFIVFDCGLYGEVNLQNLPKGMESLHVPNNHISGVIRLYELPKSLERLDFSGNSITAVFVPKKDMAASLVAVDITKQESRVRIWHFCEKSMLSFLKGNDAKYTKLNL